MHLLMQRCWGEQTRSATAPSSFVLSPAALGLASCRLSLCHASQS
jgi:hypothetical protein